MIIKILGAIDILCALGILLFRFVGFIPQKVILVLSVILLTKGLIFLLNKDFASIGDVISGVIMILAIHLTVPGTLILLISFFLLQKGAFSFLG